MEVYDQNAPLLVAQGYHPLPTAPADFQPAKAPVKWVPAYNKHVLFRGWAERTSPVLTPQPGANIGVRCGRGLVAFDYDEEEAALVISEAFDPSPVNKAGQRAWTPFYRPISMCRPRISLTPQERKFCKCYRPAGRR